MPGVANSTMKWPNFGVRTLGHVLEAEIRHTVLPPKLRRPLLPSGSARMSVARALADELASHDGFRCHHRCAFRVEAQKMLRTHMRVEGSAVVE